MGVRRQFANWVTSCIMGPDDSLIVGCESPVGQSLSTNEGTEQVSFDLAATSARGNRCHVGTLGAGVDYERVVAPRFDAEMGALQYAFEERYAGATQEVERCACLGRKQ